MLTLMRACCHQLVLGHLSYWRLWYRRVLRRRRLQRSAPRAPRALRHARARTRASGGGAAVDGGGAGLAARAGAARPGGITAAPPQTCPVSTEGWTRHVQLVREGCTSEVVVRCGARTLRSRAVERSRSACGRGAAAYGRALGRVCGAAPAPSFLVTLMIRMARLRCATLRKAVRAREAGDRRCAARLMHSTSARATPRGHALLATRRPRHAPHGSPPPGGEATAPTRPGL